jgi:hypothetical protein
VKQKTPVSASVDRATSHGFDLEAVYTILIRAYLQMEMERLDNIDNRLEQERIEEHLQENASMAGSFNTTSFVRYVQSDNPAMAKI